MKKIVPVFILLLAFCELQAQETISLSNIDSLYLFSTGTGRNYIDGRDYIRYFFQSVDNPLLRYDEERSASIISNGRKYSGIVLNYDTYTDQVILTDKTLILNDKVREVALNSNNISRFDLYFEHDILTFRDFVDEPKSAFNLKEGYY